MVSHDDLDNPTFETHVAMDPGLRHKWLALLPLAHAITIFIASRLKTTWSEVDVDKECLDILEGLMFERSARAGIAGYCQWGLDTGDHQECWDPYSGTPEHWNHGDRVDSDGELERGPKFVTVNRPAANANLNIAQRPRPKPKLKKKGLIPYYSLQSLVLSYNTVRILVVTIY